MNLHKMIEICLKDDNMHIFVMINALICINNYVITWKKFLLPNLSIRFNFCMIRISSLILSNLAKIAILTFENFSRLQFAISPRNQDHF